MCWLAVVLRGAKVRNPDYAALHPDYAPNYVSKHEMKLILFSASICLFNQQKNVLHKTHI
jgi:hypothetical protein